MRRALLYAVLLVAGAYLGLGLAAGAAELGNALGGHPTARASSCHTRPCWRRVHRARARRVCIRRHGRAACNWRAHYRELPAWRRDYIAALMRCEAGRFSAGDYDVDGSGFIFRAEWTRRTWLNAGGNLSRPPSLWEEAVRVSRTLDRVGFHTTAGWPNCP